MSKRETRIARAWMIHYSKLASRPQRGCIVFGAGLDRTAAMDEATAQGYYVSQDCGGYVTLH